MADVMKLSILTPEKEVFNGEVTGISTETTMGPIGIFADHMPLVTMLKPAVTEFVKSDGNKLKAFTSSGILEIAKNNIRFLCDSSEWPEEIDEKRAEEAKKRAEERLKKNDGIDVKRAEIALARALARLRTK